MTRLVDQVLAREAELDFAGFFALVAQAATAEASASPVGPREPDWDTQRAADADAAVAASMTDARGQVDAWKRGNDRLLD